MENPAPPVLSSARSRMGYLLALADSFVILYLMGPELGRPLLGVMRSPEVMGGFYGRHIASTADQVLNASPRLKDLLSADDWEETVLVPYRARL